jgi:hypothetical protein
VAHGPFGQLIRCCLDVQPGKWVAVGDGWRRSESPLPCILRFGGARDEIASPQGRAHQAPLILNFLTSGRTALLGLARVLFSFMALKQFLKFSAQELWRGLDRTILETNEQSITARRTNPRNRSLAIGANLANIV